MTDISPVYAPNLDLNLLRVFAVVAREGSVTRAAQRLYVTQPAVSAALRRLGDFVGDKLFVRQGRGLALTPRGVALAEAAREPLASLVAATTSGPLFDPVTSTALFRLGLSDGLETIVLPRLLSRLRVAAPKMRVVIAPVQFRTVEHAILSESVDLAIAVADELPRSIVRCPMYPSGATVRGFVCLYDSRHLKLSRRPSERDYFAQGHVAVSYAGDLRGIVEDATGKTRDVRVVVPSLSHVVDVVDGSTLVATIPSAIARHAVALRPHLRIAPLPFVIEPVPLEMLWLRSTNDDPTAAFFRDVLFTVGADLARRS